MGKVEILTLIAGVFLSIALALIVVPAMTNGVDYAKTNSLINEIQTMRKVSINYAKKQPTSDFTGINAEQLKIYIPALNLNTNNPKRFISKEDNRITYLISSTNGSDLVIVLSGLTSIKDAEKKLIDFYSKTITITDSNNNDGNLTLNFLGE